MAAETTATAHMEPAVTSSPQLPGWTQLICAAATAALLTLPATAHCAESIVTERAEGAPMTIPLSGGVVVNSTSRLRRQHIRIVDQSAPAALSAATGADVVYQARGDYEYVLNWTVQAKEPIAAVEIRTLVYDVFGRYLSTLVAVEVGDFATTASGMTRWRIPLESEAKSAHTSVSFVWRARTAAGAVYGPSAATIAAAVRQLGITAAETQQIERSDQLRLAAAGR